MAFPQLRRHRITLFSLRLWQRRVAFWGGAVVVGLAASLFALGSDQAHKIFQATLGLSRWLPLLITPLTLAGVAWLTRRYFKGAEGSGIPQTIAAIRMSDEKARAAVLSVRLVAGKMLLTCIGMAGGASVGREGPSVQIGAALLYSLRNVVRFPRHIMERGLIVAGGGAGVAAAFNTPLAGIVFAIEEMARSFEEKSSGTLLTAVIVAGIAAIYVLGNYTYFGSTNSSLIGNDAWLVVPLVGVVGGLLGGGFSRLLLIIARRGLPGRVGAMMRERPVAFAAGCGLVLAILGLLSGDSIYGTGYFEARHLLESGADAPAGYGLMKMAATLVSFISGIPGGLFAPSLSAGAGIGHSLAALFDPADHGALVVLGMAAYFAGVVQAPITAFVIVMEMTDNHEMILPLMISTLLASAISSLVCDKPLYKALAEIYLGKVAPLASSPSSTPST